MAQEFIDERHIRKQYRQEDIRGFVTVAFLAGLLGWAAISAANGSDVAAGSGAAKDVPAKVEPVAADAQKQ